ncbi:hypothetical protein MG295_00120 [Bacillus phage vB_BcgM]|nr:hypothetical protein MG295_00120 [Bacillus phage vB_BcgM]
MECNNKYCVWNMFDQCCPDGEERFNEATPNELDCPSSLREDLQEGLYITRDEILDIVDELGEKSRVYFLNHILSQRDEGVNLEEALEALTTKTLIYMMLDRRNLRELLDLKKSVTLLNTKRPWHITILSDDDSNLKSVSGVRPKLSAMTEEDMPKWKSKQK